MKRFITLIVLASLFSTVYAAAKDKGQIAVPVPHKTYTFE